MKHLRIFACVLLALALGSLAWGQVVPVTITQQVNWPLFTTTPNVTQANLSVVGNPGPQTYYYWFVAHYTLGATAPLDPSKF